MLTATNGVSTIVANKLNVEIVIMKIFPYRDFLLEQNIHINKLLAVILVININIKYIETILSDKQFTGDFCPKRNASSIDEIRIKTFNAI